MAKKIKAELELRRKGYENTHEYRLEYEMENLLEWIAYEEEKMFTETLLNLSHLTDDQLTIDDRRLKEDALKGLADVAVKIYTQQFPQ